MKQIRQLTDSEGHSFWRESMRVVSLNRLLGRPVADVRICAQHAWLLHSMSACWGIFSHTVIHRQSGHADPTLDRALMPKPVRSASSVRYEGDGQPVPPEALSPQSARCLARRS